MNETRIGRRLYGISLLLVTLPDIDQGLRTGLESQPSVRDRRFDPKRLNHCNGFIRDAVQYSLEQEHQRLMARGKILCKVFSLPETT